MAIVTFDMEELQRFIGKSRPPEEISAAFEALGMPVERMEEGFIDIDVTPDRIDMLTVEGAGRALSFYLGVGAPRPFRIMDAKETMSVDPIVARPAIVAGIVRGIEINDGMIKSMIQAQEKIHETFGRKRKKVAIGIHDLDKTTPPYSYRPFKYITFVPLDTDKEMNPQQILKEHPKGKEYSWVYEGVSEYPMVVDSKGVISFPPIINAERTRVTESTENLFIEITGTSERAVRDTLHVFLTAFHDRGAKIENVRLKLVDGQKDSAMFGRKEKLDIAFMNKTLGIRLKPAEAAALLSRMGHIATAGDKTIEIEVPPYRADIMHQVDFIEDVAIAYGYEKFKPILPRLITVGKELDSTLLEDRLRMTMVGLSFNEIMTWTLTNDEKNRAAEITEESVEIKNPRTKDFTNFRTSLLPSLLSTLADNKTKRMPQKIFEIGRVADVKGNCRTVLGAAITGARATFSDAKGVLDVVAAVLKLKAEQEDKPFCILGRCVSVRNRKGSVGWCGEISPQVLQNFRLEMPVAAFEVFL